MGVVNVGGAAVECDQRGAGPHLLLIHSLLTEMTVFNLVLPGLVAGRTVTRINLPGFGASSPIVLDTVGDHADHVARVMDALKLPSDTTVFGNGFGAFVALELAIRHGKRFGKLIVADALAAFPEPARVPFRLMAEKVSSGGMQAVLDTAIGRMFPPAFAQAHPDIIADRKAKLANVDPQCFARACRALASMDVTTHIGEIKNRSLVMCGALDQTTPPALAKQLAEKIRARYEEIPDSGHCPMLEQSHVLAREIDSFI
ncbi:MAG: alpha/beta fold hydrolase [Burkholderiales bacterium]